MRDKEAKELNTVSLTVEEVIDLTLLYKMLLNMDTLSTDTYWDLFDLSTGLEAAYNKAKASRDRLITKYAPRDDKGDIIRDKHGNYGVADDNIQAYYAELNPLLAKVAIKEFRVITIPRSEVDKKVLRQFAIPLSKLVNFVVGPDADDETEKVKRVK